MMGYWNQPQLTDVGELLLARVAHLDRERRVPPRDAEQRAARSGIPVFVPPLSLSTDNAAMIGAAALRKLQQGATGDYGFNAEASLAL